MEEVEFQREGPANHEDGHGEEDEGIERINESVIKGGNDVA
jgi:hypothetical protein